METVKGSNPLEAMRWQTESKKYVENDNGMLTQEDFFALLTQELAHQDPTKPVDNNEMISQMTAFSTTDGVTKLNQKFSEFSAVMSSSQALQASTLVGRSVLVDDNTFGLAEGGGAKGKLVTDKPATQVFMYVENAAGQVIQTVPVGSVDKGEFTFTWDGQTSNEQQAPEGVYRFRIYGLVEGEQTEIQAMTYRKVDSVTLAGAGGNILLNLNGGSSMALADVVEVSEG
ncbi:MAG: flagellar hook assembly protein FlgD [Alteromonadaceae bacterium]|nr:flagellar hook assembly protein FlgD [Alteromonadaceae bacterium]